MTITPALQEVFPYGWNSEGVSAIQVEAIYLGRYRLHVEIGLHHPRELYARTCTQIGTVETRL